MEAGALAKDVGACAVLESSGYAQVRRFWQMGIDLAGSSVTEPMPPPGVTRSVAASEGHRRLLHSIHESAFAEHFGSVPRPYEQWLPWHKDRQDAAPDLWWLAWVEDEPVAEITPESLETILDYRSIWTLFSAIQYNMTAEEKKS